MVCLSAMVMCKSGKMLLSRQFVPMARIRVESLVAAFPKLVDSKTQHTFVETEDVRYVYQPLDQLYLVLVTNKSSNIMEDLETLKILAKLVPEYCSGVTEEDVVSNVFDLIHAFDEVLSLGHKEQVSMQQIKTFLEMDSHEEKLHQIIMESKMNEARDEARRKAEEIDSQKARMKMLMNKDNDDRFSRASNFDTPQTFTPSPTLTTTDSSSTRRGGSDTKTKKKRKPLKGMKIRKAQAADDFASAFAQEENLQPVQPAQDVEEVEVKVKTPAAAQSGVDVQVVINEYLQLLVDDDSEIKKFEIKGEVKISINNPLDNRATFQFSPLDDIKSRTPSKVDSSAWSTDNKIGLINGKGSWPVGSSKSTTALRWKQSIRDPDEVPMLFTVWADAEDDGTILSLELAHQKEDFVLYNVVVSIPCPGGAPEIRASTSDCVYDADESAVKWTIPEVSAENNAGSIELFCPDAEPAALHPIAVTFESESSYSGLTLQGVEPRDEGEVPTFTCTTCLTATKYFIVSGE